MDVPENDSVDSSFKQMFEQKLTEYENQHQGSRKKPWTRDRISEVINHVKKSRINLEGKGRRVSMDYYWKSKYEILIEGNEEHLIFKKKTAQAPTLRIIPREEYFDVLTRIHAACGHGGRDKMLSSFNTQYYITKRAVETYISLCPTCETKRCMPKKQHFVSQDSYITGHIDIMDLNSYPDGDYKWLLKYQDCNSKFLSLRPLTSNQTKDVALELIKIFTTFGAPNKIYSINETKFIAGVLRELTVIWPTCKIIFGSSKLRQIQENIKQNSHDVINFLQSWMSQQKSTNWSIGCYFVQYQINTSQNHVIEKSPFKALFGREPIEGLNSSANSPSVCSNVKTKEQYFSHNMPNENSRVQEDSDNMVKENSNTQQFNDHMVNCNRNKPQLTDNMLNETSKIEIKVELNEWDPTDQNDIKPDKSSKSTNSAYEYPHMVIIKQETVYKNEDDAEFQTNEELKGIKREAETIENDMSEKWPLFSNCDTLSVTVPKAECATMNIKKKK